MYVKIHVSPTGEIVALCDTELIGKVLAEGKKRLDLEKYAGFYKGEKISEAKAVLILSETENANIVGEKSVKAAKKAGLDISGTIKIGGVPHLQLYRI